MALWADMGSSIDGFRMSSSRILAIDTVVVEFVSYFVVVTTSYWWQFGVNI